MSLLASLSPEAVEEQCPCRRMLGDRLSGAPPCLSCPVWRTPRARAKNFLRLVRNGRVDRFPWCCVLRFSFEHAWNGPMRMTTQNTRGFVSRPDDPGGTWVPCGLFHRAERRRP
jgi:hypothetical protein